MKINFLSNIAIVKRLVVGAGVARYKYAIEKYTINIKCKNLPGKKKNYSIGIFFG